jgi:hypothetical protein
MSGIEDLTATRDMLRELVRIVTFTRQTLAERIQEETERPAWRRSSRQAGQLAGTLEHLGDVREGFILSQRASPQLSLSDLRALVRHILLDWEWLQELNVTLAPQQHIESLDQQLVVFNHALVALAVLPTLPAEAVTFPQRQPSYSDVAAPVLPGELLARIEEIEYTIYQADLKPVSSLDYGPFRRAYAFFEASSWLANTQLKPLLGGSV